MNTPSFPTSPTALITQDFGNHNPKFYAGDGKHTGIDYGVPVGSPVHACIDGRVTTAVQDAQGYGRHVRITHADGAVSIYGHMQTLAVKFDEMVTSGQQIGTSGGDPNDNVPGDGTSTGAHLHWEIRKDGKPVDPEQYCLGLMTANARTATVTATDGLNIRTSAGGAWLRLAAYGEVLKVVDVFVGWARLLSLRPEWCSAEYLAFDGAVNPPVDMYAKIEQLWNAHPELW